MRRLKDRPRRASSSSSSHRWHISVRRPVAALRYPHATADCDPVIVDVLSELARKDSANVSQRCTTSLPTNEQRNCPTEANVAVQVFDTPSRSAFRPGLSKKERRRRSGRREANPRSQLGNMPRGLSDPGSARSNTRPVTGVEGVGLQSGRELTKWASKVTVPGASALRPAVKLVPEVV